MMPASEAEVMLLQSLGHSEADRAVYHKAMRLITLDELRRSQAETAELARQRDILAQRCAAQSREIAALLSGADPRRSTLDIETVLDRVRTDADEAGCFHFDMLRRALANG